MAIGMQRRVCGHRAISVILGRQQDLHINALGKCMRLELRQTHAAIVQDLKNVKATFLLLTPPPLGDTGNACCE